MPIKDINKIPQFKIKLKQLKKYVVQVGILGNEPSPQGDRANLALIAAANEYGTTVIPERSWLRSSFDDKSNFEEIKKIADQIFDVDSIAKPILNKVGLKMVSLVQKKIKSNIPPANSTLTTMRKGGKDRTLMDTGRLSQGITHEIK